MDAYIEFAQETPKEAADAEHGQALEDERWTGKPRLLGTSRDPPQHLERTSSRSC